ncbi:peptide-methionine (R)-S-oxide reductase MsrB [Lacinutrix jangbogonensis]|uniref:peptide-methionine (R)-S-oxide reductase MsrB n=1 Tax=Lacinutrix jangbogonensis TaxID=1469557 RepID=UPI00053EAA69|nr:peptide-methionine (R)-S-oxide reductase MsrB [Lacinutrix jangbogonensis]
MLTWKDIIKFSVKGNPTPNRRVEKTNDEWRAQLTPEQFRITRQKGTERAHSGALCSIYDAGMYTCICCNTPLFDSAIKFSSGTGWPSFTQPIKGNAIKYEKDAAFGIIRIEVICNTCNAHLGHVFPDGPEPSGLRYCINSESIQIEKEEANEY